MDRLYRKFHVTLTETLADVDGLNDALEILHRSYQQSKTTDKTCLDERLVEELVIQYNGLTKSVLVAILLEHMDTLMFKNASEDFKDNEVSCIVENKMIAVAETLIRRSQKSIKPKTVLRGK